MRGGLNRGFTVYVPYLLTIFKFLFFVPYVFLGLFVYPFQTMRRLRIFVVVVVVVFNYIKYTFNSTRTARNLKKGNSFLDENQVV